MDRVKRKKIQEEEDQKLAEVLRDFKDTFENNKTINNMSFIRGEVVNSDKKYAALPPVMPKPAPVPVVLMNQEPVFKDAMKKAAETAQRLMAQTAVPKVSLTLNNSAPILKTRLTGFSAPSKEASTIPPPVNRPPKPGKAETKPRVSNLEAFKNELKSLQEQRAERKHERTKELQASGLSGDELTRMKAVLQNPYLDANYSEYAENQETTNLHISYLPVDTTVEELYETFGTFGPLASARVLHPRTGEQRQYLFAFVAYMCRKDAERALAIMNGSEFAGCEIKVNWGKVVEIPSVPFYLPPALAALALPDSPTGLPFNAKPRQSDLEEFLRKHGRLPELTHLFIENEQKKVDYNKMLRNAIVRVVIPTDRPLLKLIHRTIEYVVREGPQFEASIMAREIKNPAFRFLYENTQPTHTYYRWKLFSILEGDDKNKWRTDRFRMFDEGSWWEPPPHELYKEMPPQLYYTCYKPKAKGEHFKKRHLVEYEREREQDIERSRRKRGALTDDDRDFLEQLLRNLTPKRRHVGFAMCWCLRRAKSAREIIDCIVEALMIPETPLYKKLGRFYLLSDILANCEVVGPDIAHFRQHIQSKLDGIFQEFNAVMKKIPTRINQAQFRSRIAKCIQLWSDNTIYSKQELIQHQNTFYGLKDPNGPSSRDNSDMETASDSDHDDRSNSPKNGTQKQTSLTFKAEDEWVQVDPAKEKAIASASKWEREDYIHPREDRYYATSSSYRSREPPPKKSSFSGINLKLGSANKPEVMSATNKTSDEKRKILRDIETQVILFQEELEDARDPFMQEKVEQYREDLLQKADLTNFAESSEAAQNSNRREPDDFSRESRYSATSNRWPEGYRY